MVVKTVKIDPSGNSFLFMISFGSNTGGVKQTVGGTTATMLAADVIVQTT